MRSNATSAARAGLAARSARVGRSAIVAGTSVRVPSHIEIRLTLEGGSTPRTLDRRRYSHLPCVVASVGVTTTGTNCHQTATSANAVC